VKRLMSSFLLAVTATCALAAGARTAHADRHVLLILDLTGSMSASSAGGMARIDVAKAQLKAVVQAVPAPGTEYALWTFESNTFTRVFSFTDPKTTTDLENAINAASLGGSTPLAHTVCAAVDELFNYKPNVFADKVIELATDGEENNTAPLDQCFGPPSATKWPTLDVNSWQWKVRNKACTGSPGSPGPCNNPTGSSSLSLIINVYHLFDFISFRGVPTNLEAGPKTRSISGSGAQTLSASDDAAFFAGLASVTHGRYSAITLATPLAQAFPVPGDANSDGCVNVADRALVLQQFGTAGSADLNHDGVVNTFDLQTVLQNFGRGCTAVP